MSSASPLDGKVSRRDRLASCAVGLGVLLLYAVSRASVPISDGLACVANSDWACETGAMPTFSNAPSSYRLTLLLKTVPPLVLLLVLGPMVRERTGCPLRGSGLPARSSWRSCSRTTAPVSSSPG